MALKNVQISVCQNTLIHTLISTSAYFARSVIENSFNTRDKQRCQQTISKGELNFRFITVARLCNFIMHEHKLYKFAYFVPLNRGKFFVRLLKRDSV